MELTIEQALEQGVAAHRAGKLDEAERLYRTILQSEPKHPHANHNLGVLIVSINQAEAALPLLKKALESDPKVEQFWLSYIDALIKTEQIDNAKQIIEKGKRHGVDKDKLDVFLAKLSPAAQRKGSNSSSPTQQQLDSLLEFYQTGRYEEAEQLALSMTEQFPEHPFGWKVFGS